MGAAISVLISTAAFQVALTIEAWMLERVHPFSLSLLKPAARGADSVRVGFRAACVHACGPGARDVR